MNFSRKFLRIPYRRFPYCRWEIRELEEYLETMALENPVIETEEKSMVTDIGQDGERKIPRKSYGGLSEQSLQR